MGVRGVNLADGDRVISLSILNHFEAGGDERAAYLKRAVALRRAQGAEVVDDPAIEPEEGAAVDLSDERFEAMRAAEQIILTVSENGYGKRTRHSNIASPDAAAKALSRWR